jgi:hypothetical protein
LYVSQGATLVAFGCGDRHPLPVVLAPCSAGSSSALCDDLGDALNDGSNAGRKVSNSSAIIRVLGPGPLLELLGYVASELDDMMMHFCP